MLVFVYLNQIVYTDFHPAANGMDYDPLLSVDISCNGYERLFSDCNITNGANSSACPSNRTRSFYCSRRKLVIAAWLIVSVTSWLFRILSLFFLEFMPFLDLDLPDQELFPPVDILHSKSEDEVMNIAVPNMRIGSHVVETAYVSNNNGWECHYTCKYIHEWKNTK